jgi:hypothetical protein
VPCKLSWQLLPPTPAGREPAVPRALAQVHPGIGSIKCYNRIQINIHISYQERVLALRVEDLIMVVTLILFLLTSSMVSP